MGHIWDRCGHNSDAQEVLLFLQILWADCHENCHGLPTGIKQKSYEKKIGLLPLSCPKIGKQRGFSHTVKFFSKNCSLYNHISNMKIAKIGFDN